MRRTNCAVRPRERSGNSFFDTIDTKEVNEQLNLSMLDLDRKDWKPQMVEHKMAERKRITDFLLPVHRPGGRSKVRPSHPHDPSAGRLLQGARSPSSKKIALELRLGACRTLWTGQGRGAQATTKPPVLLDHTVHILPGKSEAAAGDSVILLLSAAQGEGAR